MEAFQYEGVQIFNPHHSVGELSIPAKIRCGDAKLAHRIDECLRCGRPFFGEPEATLCTGCLIEDS